MIRRIVVILTLSLWLGATVRAQETPLDPGSAPEIVTYQQVYVFAGPGATHTQVGILNADVPVRVLERNASGTWVHINRLDNAGGVLLDGWIISGYVQGRSALNFGDMPVNTTLPDNVPANASSPSLGDIYAAPVIPAISDAMMTVYADGQALGNHADVITKIGDSLSASHEYLEPMANPVRTLNAFRYLTETVYTYGASMAFSSVAAGIGMSSYVVFDPMWADPARGCMAGEGPLACEYRIKRPSVAFIMFGPNDVRSMTDAIYADNMRRIVNETMTRGIIPVVSTFSVHPNDEFYWQGINFNRQLVTLANELQFPLINLWAAARTLPNYGLDIDNIHLTFSGYDELYYDSGNEAYSGVALHNLLSIRTLAAIHERVRDIPITEEGSVG